MQLFCLFGRAILDDLNWGATSTLLWFLSLACWVAWLLCDEISIARSGVLLPRRELLAYLSFESSFFTQAKPD